jgi:hypothetical protein
VLADGLTALLVAFKSALLCLVERNVNENVVLQQICKQTPRFTIGDCAGGHRADNREKNRDVLIVPRKIRFARIPHSA